MSRCFPFPPPGYEKKARTDDVDLLKKEKHKEKKHKKEKKDKEKRRSKEKSDGKHREKKDKKERDKWKDKEKDRDLVKDKISTSDEKRVPGKNEGHGEERYIQKEYKGNCIDKRITAKIGGYQAEKLGQYSHLAEQNQNSVTVELGTRSKHEVRAIGNHLIKKITELDGNKDEGMVRLLTKGTDILAEVKEKNKDRRVDDRRTDEQGVRGAAQVSGNTMVQNLLGVVEPKVELSRPLASNVDRKIVGKEKTKEKEGGDKRKDKHREKKKQGKDKDKDKEKKIEAKAKEKIESKNGEPYKEKKKEEKAKEKNETKNAEPNKSRKSNKEDHIDSHSVITSQLPEDSNKTDKSRKSDKEDHIDSHSVITSQLPEDSNKTAGADGNLKKRKDIQANGVVHANDIRPRKLSRPSSSSHELPVNGRTVEPCQNSVPYESDRLGAANNIKVDVKDRKITGSGEAPSLAVPVAEACMKPPHPDSRYLSHVYLVPKLDEMPDHDDQDWLFGCSDAQLKKKPKVESSRVEETPKVWSEVVRIESADVHALPYVIPY